MEVLHSRAIHYDQTLAGKIDFYLVIVTAFSGGLVLIAPSDNNELVSLALPAACLVLSFLLIVGVSTLRQCMDLAATVTTLYRRVGRLFEAGGGDRDARSAARDSGSEHKHGGGRPQRRSVVCAPLWRAAERPRAFAFVHAGRGGGAGAAGAGVSRG
jgi:hypothetical protein